MFCFQCVEQQVNAVDYYYYYYYLIAVELGATYLRLRDLQVEILN